MFLSGVMFGARWLLIDGPNPSIATYANVMSLSADIDVSAATRGCRFVNGLSHACPVLLQIARWRSE